MQSLMKSSKFEFDGEIVREFAIWRIFQCWEILTSTVKQRESGKEESKPVLGFWVLPNGQHKWGFYFNVSATSNGQKTHMQVCNASQFLFYAELKLVTHCTMDNIIHYIISHINIYVYQYIYIYTYRVVRLRSENYYFRRKWKAYFPRYCLTQTLTKEAIANLQFPHPKKKKSPIHWNTKNNLMSSTL